MYAAPAKGPADIECLCQRWAKLFPGWKRLLVSDAPPKLAVGTWLFKVSLYDVWRRLSVPCQCTLSNLAPAICSAFGFDFDHLYAFYYRGTTGAEVSVCDGRAPDENVMAHELAVGPLPIHPGDRFRFLYDFGNGWKFTINAEELLPKKNTAIKVVKKEGVAPKQYGRYG